MEIEIALAVLATGLVLIGGMLVIWKDYRGHRPPNPEDKPSQNSN